MWAYLNWCLGLQESGCEIWWLEELEAGSPTEQRQRLAALKTRLAPFGMANRIALWSKDDKPLPPALAECPGVESVCGAELLLDLNYGTTASVIGRFRRSALIDIDPGLLQTWVTQGDFCLAPHDLYFSIGETVGQPDAKFPDLGLQWRYTPPCVALRHWPVVPAPAPAPFTTITHWHSLDWLQDDAGEYQSNEKRTGFLPFVDLPRRTSQTLELALHLREKEDAATAGCSRTMAGESRSPGLWLPRHVTTSGTFRVPWESSVARSHPAFSFRTPGSVIVRFATLRAASLQSCNIPAQAGSCPKNKACFAFGIRRRPCALWKRQWRIMTGTAGWHVSLPRNTSTQKRSAKDSWSRR
jgi:hypothetical protein